MLRSLSIPVEPDNKAIVCDNSGASLKRSSLRFIANGLPTDEEKSEVKIHPLITVD
jgi:hypothetical protein